MSSQGFDEVSVKAPTGGYRHRQLLAQDRWVAIANQL